MARSLPPSSRCSQRARLVALSLALYGVGVCAPISAAQACPAIIMTPASAAAATEVADITALTTAFKLGMDKFVDALTRLGNQKTNVVQIQASATAPQADKINTTRTANALGAERVRAMAETMPSRDACIKASAMKRLAATDASYASARSKLATDNTAYSLGLKGSDSEKGSLASANKVFTNRCSRYANAADLDLPGCNGPSDPAMVDRDIMFKESVLQMYNLDNANDKQAATDAVKMLVEPVAKDGLSGAALGRLDGQNLMTARFYDATRMNVARMPLEDMVSLRMSPTVAGADGKKNSRYARYVELITGQKVTGQTIDGEQPDIANAIQLESANLKSSAMRLASQKMMLSELLRVTDQLIMVESARLATDVQKTRIGSMASASMSGN